MATSRSDYWNETYTPRLMDRAAALPQERRMILFIKKTQHIDFFLDIQQYIVIGIVIPP